VGTLLGVSDGSLLGVDEDSTLGMSEGPAVGFLVDMGMKNGRSGNVIGADGLVEKLVEGNEDGKSVGMSVGVNVGICDRAEEFVTFRIGTDLDETTTEAALAVAPTAVAATTPVELMVSISKVSRA
jgi:hypothetical protein